MVPQFNTQGNLPQGIHAASWHEIVQLFGRTSHRQMLLKGLREAVRSLKKARCQMLYLDGSFVTDKEAIYGAVPDDYDGCWEPRGVDPALLDPVLLDFKNQRAAQKAKFGGELFPSTLFAAPHGPTYLDFFQVDKRTGLAKGIVSLDLLQLDEVDLQGDLVLNSNPEVAPSSQAAAEFQSQAILLCFDKQPMRSSQGYRP